MSEPSSHAPAKGPGFRQIVLWTTFTVLLVVGLVLYFRYSGRLLPLLDAVGDR